MTPQERALADEKLASIFRRINEIAGLEAQSAWVNGWAAQGNLMPEKMRLINDADRILDRLQREIFGPQDRGSTDHGSGVEAREVVGTYVEKGKVTGIFSEKGEVKSTHIGVQKKPGEH